MRRAPLAAAATVALLALSGCSSDQTAAEETPDPASILAAGWSPCDDLTAASVSRLVGSAVQEELGTAEEPRCTFTPKRAGGAAYDVSYLWFDGGLSAALDAMGASGTQFEPVEIEGAEAARIVVRAQKSGVLVTGFVQTKGLVQSVNAVQIAPYDEQEVVAGTKALLAELAGQAPAPGSQ